MLPEPARAWVKSVLSDVRYKHVKSARNPLIHSKLSRIMDGHSRTEFRVKDSSPLSADALLHLAKDVATEHVTSFLVLLESI